MFHWSANRRIAAVGAAILIASLIVSLTPWYKAYCAYDQRWVCAKIRMQIESRYSELNEEGQTGYAYGSEELIRQACIDICGSDIPAFHVDENPLGQTVYWLADVCQGGGNINIIVQDTGNILIRCDNEYHNIDYSQLPEVD